MKIIQMATSISAAWSNCPRCHTEHQMQILTAFEEAIGGGYTHYALCSTRNQPVLFRLLGEEHIEFGRALQKLGQ